MHQRARRPVSLPTRIKWGMVSKAIFFTHSIAITVVVVTQMRPFVTFTLERKSIWQANQHPLQFYWINIHHQETTQHTKIGEALLHKQVHPEKCLEHNTPAICTFLHIIAQAQFFYFTLRITLEIALKKVFFLVYPSKKVQMFIIVFFVRAEHYCTGSVFSLLKRLMWNSVETAVHLSL